MGRTLLLSSLLIASAAAYEPSKVATGSAAPDFAAPRNGGGEFRLSELKGKNVVLVFYRGHW